MLVAAGVRRPQRPAKDDISTLMAIIRMFFAAAFLGVMLGTAPAQESRIEKLEGRVVDQAISAARLEQQVAQITAKLQRIEGYQEAAFYGIVGIFGKYVFEGVMALARRKRDDDPS
jgi:hypothetical protein